MKRAHRALPFLSKWEPSRYPPGYLRRLLSEDKVQAAAMQYLLSIRRVFAAEIDAGAKDLRGRAYGALKRAGLSTAALAGRTGAARKGVVDIVGCEAGRSFFIEMKAPAWVDNSGKVIRSAGFASEDQLDFLLTAHMHGAIVGVAWSVEDVIEILGRKE